MCEYCGEEWDFCGQCGGCLNCGDCFCETEGDDDLGYDDIPSGEVSA